ncbi:hypothetical protein [Kutzneria sp. CA-103260]|uniref:hypothetical protein n=1 Tax=Kutzneria sp. CA-103260 TaxID=2802641 RepID=UPI001BAA2565|nr:hypothetical protein [Kutzneria sp. CA-103260]QUQ63697.1 hypothetical protein JJ691_14100 [Kutzneria sp. CA-103260]
MAGQDQHRHLDPGDVDVGDQAAGRPGVAGRWAGAQAVLDDLAAEFVTESTVDEDVVDGLRDGFPGVVGVRGDFPLSLIGAASIQLTASVAMSYG